MSNKETTTIMSMGIMNLDKIFPVGSVYINVGESDPSVLFGGDWEKIGEGRTLIQCGESKPLGTRGGVLNYMREPIDGENQHSDKRLLE